LVQTLRRKKNLAERQSDPLPLPHRGKKVENFLTVGARRRERSPTSKDAASVNSSKGGIDLDAGGTDQRRRAKNDDDYDGRIVASASL